MRILIVAAALALPASAQLAFEPNRGQTDPAVRFLARTSQASVFFTSSEVVLGSRGAPLRLELLKADRGAAWEPVDANGKTTSYIRGRDARKWVRDVPQYARLLRRGVYPGIDVAYYGNAGRLEYDFLLAPHADPDRIRMHVAGASRLRLEADGALVVETADGSLRQAKPEVYQTGAGGVRVPVEGRFRLMGRDTVAFALGRYDSGLPLAIDPVLLSSSYIGGHGDDRIVSVGQNGQYAGTTTSIDFPGAAYGRRNGDDIVVNNGYTVFVIGGSGNDEVTSAFFSNGTAVVVGYTDSQDLPTNVVKLRYNTPPVWQPDFAGGATDGFFLWISGGNNGQAPEIYLSYIGTPGDDRVTGIAGNYYYALVGTTTGGGLPGVGAAGALLSTPLQPIQSAPAGGIDGFLMLIEGFDYQPTIMGATLFGGSGDDRPLGIWSYPNSASAVFYITGETNSPDFPLVNPLFSTRAGDTDAFLMRVAIKNYAFQITSSTLLGGSQADRGVALAMNSAGNMVLAGTTSSGDLPVTANALQPAYGGGDSDVFIAQFLPDLSQMVSLTYYGGSSAEEATSAAADGFGSVYVGGWTSSTDFPVTNASQPIYGGGADDGFLLHFDVDGSLYEATYFGGSGSDRIYGISAYSDFTAWLAGQTTSSDLPVAGTGTGTLTGTSDGFLAQTGSALLGVYACSGSNHLRATCYASLGALNGDATAPLTITSSDPSSVLLAADATSASQAAITVAPQPNYSGGSRSFTVDCQVDTGGGDLTITALGYPSRTVHANCYPVQLAVQAYSGTYLGAQGAITTNSWYGPAKFTVTLKAVNPNPPSDWSYVYPSPSVPTVTVQIATSNPAAGTVDPSLVFTQNAGSTASVGFTFQPGAPGNTVLTFSSADVSLSESYPIAVESPIGLPSAAIPGGFQTPMNVYSGTAPTGTSATITSQDPGSLVFTTDPNQPGVGTITVPLGTTTVFAQALASTGDIPVTVAVPGLDPVTAPVHLAPPVVFCQGCSPAVSMVPLTQLAIYPYIGTAVSPGRYQLSRNPGLDPVVLTIATSDATVVSVPATSVSFGGGAPSNNQGGFTITAAGTGAASVTLQATGGVVPDPGASPMAVTVQKVSPKMPDIEVGKDLAGVMSLILPAIPAAKVTVTVADPTLALLSANNQAAGQAQLSLTTSPNQTLSFYVQGLASSGQTQVTATVAGYGSVTATVRLDPSGIVWFTDTYSTVQYSYGAAYTYLGAYALDAASLLPLANQRLRFGASAPFQLSNSNPAVVTASPANPSIPASNTYLSIGLTPVSAGTANIAIVQPAGFSTPAVRQTLAVTVQEASLTLSDAVMGKDTQTPVLVNIPGGGSKQLTLTSSDPSKLVLSTSASAPGAASVTITSGTSQQVLAQALDSRGTVRITASVPGYRDAVATYTLKGLGVGIAVTSSYQTGSAMQTNGVALTTTQSPNTQIAVNLFLVDTVSGTPTSVSYQAAFRAGVTPPPVTVTSSDTTVGKILRSPAVPVLSASMNQPSVDFSPVGLGTTTVSVTQPAGFFAPAGLDSIPFQVTLPGFTAFSTLMGKDTIVSLSPYLLNTVTSPTSNVTFTITSGDTSRVLLSSAPDNNTAATVTKVLVAGQRALNTFYVHALSNDGVVTLKMTAPGYSDTLLTVTLTDLMFRLTQYWGTSTLRAVMQNGPQTYTIGFELPPQNGTTGGYTTPTIRPGAPNIVLSVATSDPSILAVDKPQIPLAPGVNGASVVARPVSTGTAVLTLTAPSGYLTDMSANTLSISVEGAKLSYSYGLTSLGRDLQTAVTVSSESTFKQATPITITSSDPSRLLISADYKSAGQASVTVSGAQGSQSVQIFLQALTDNGSATVIATADGYQTASAPVSLAPSAAVFYGNTAAQTLYTNSGVQSIGVELATLDPATLNAVSYGLAPRPGANLTATLASSNATVVSVAPPSLTFTNSIGMQAQVKPVGLGTAIVTLSPLPGGATASSGTQIVYTVAEPDLFVGDVTVGRDLQVPLQIRLASRFPAPTSDLTVNIETNSPYTAALSNSPATAGTAYSIPVTIPAGQHLSKPFYLQGMSPGSTSLYVYGSGYNSANSQATVGQTAFIFQEALQSQNIALAVGATATLTVTPAMMPIGTPAPAGMTIRAGVTPIVLSIADLSPQVASVTPTSVTLKSGDQNATVTVRGLAAGTAAVSVGGSSAYQYPSAQASVNVQVK